MPSSPAPSSPNRTYILMLTICLVTSATMNWVGFTVTEKQGKRASHIEAYLRRYLSVRPMPARDQDGDEPTLHRGESSGDDEPNIDAKVEGTDAFIDAQEAHGVEREESETEQDDDDDTGEEAEAVEVEHDEDSDSNTGEESDGDATEDEDAEEEEDDEEMKETGGDRPVEDGGPPPEEGGVNGAAVALQVSAENAENAKNSEEAHRPIAAEHGGPPAIDGRGDSSSNQTEHRIGGLSCKKYGGPSERIAEKMVYWKDIPTDSELVSPLKQDGATRYMTFEPDGGAWNNIRMAFETVVSIAHAMGRALVLPPDQKMYLIGKESFNANFAHFYHLETLSKEHAGLTIISMEEFLEQEAMAGHMLDKISRRPSFPPGNRTNWNGERGQGMKVLHEWLRNVAHVPQWKPDRCVVAFPSARGADATSALKEAHKQIKEEVLHGDADTPVAVDAPIKERMREILNGRELCIYNEMMQKEPYIHFVSAHKLGLRLLVHYYTFLFFEDYRQGLWTKRFVRDHLRYQDELQCAAARIVHAIKDRARKRQWAALGNNSTFASTFMSMHIRRNEFQYKDMFLDAAQLYHASEEELVEDGTVFVATDEKDRNFFKPLREHYDLCFLDDFKHLFEGLNENLYGMLDQLVASRGRRFFGTYYSTFTGFINRMRGYHADKARLQGYENGAIQSFFFAPKTKRYDMATFKPPSPPYWVREFPLSWRDIDRGIEEVASIGSKKKTKTQTTPAIM